MGFKLLLRGDLCVLLVLMCVANPFRAQLYYVVLLVMLQC